MEKPSYAAEIMFMGFLFVAISLMMWVLCSCTISFQNIDTHGTATDLVDENLSTTPSTNITVPAL
jgi:hypothetical protein